MLKGYMAGCNLGHWISQYGTKGKDHYDNYITEPDLKRIAEWGCDHVRLPVDYMIFEKDDNPGEYLEEGLKYVDNAISWAHKYGLNVVLDLHHAPGYFLNHGEKNNLFTNRDSQIRFINIWKFFAERYAAIGDNLRFELLNELSCEKSEQWNNPTHRIFLPSRWRFLPICSRFLFGKVHSVDRTKSNPYPIFPYAVETPIRKWEFDRERDIQML